MPRLTAFGHPVHPILQAIPASLLPASTTFDVLARLGIDEEGLSKAAHYSLVFGLLGGGVCCHNRAFGLLRDREPTCRRIALYHGLTNATLVGSYVASFLRRKDRKADDTALALFALGAALIGLSGCLGGELVYQHGVRVGEDHDGIPGAS